ncbi:MAG: outer membrane beta-barrel protein [Pseudomonadota bacterium]
MTLEKILLVSALMISPAAVFAADWTGAYAGVQLGTSEIDVDGALEVDGAGPSFGIFAGYNFQNGALVFGGEVDYDVTEYDIADGAAEVDSTTRLKARLGTELGGGLASGTIGAVWATSPDFIGDGEGYLFGFGYDLPVADNIIVGGEVLQHEFEDYNDTGADVGVTTVKARVAFNF